MGKDGRSGSTCVGGKVTSLGTQTTAARPGAVGANEFGGGICEFGEMSHFGHPL